MTAYYLSALTFGFGCYLVGVASRRKQFDRLMSYAESVKDCAEQIQRENWSLRAALGYQPACEICERPARVQKQWMGRVVTMCHECAFEDLSFLEADNE